MASGEQQTAAPYPAKKKKTQKTSNSPKVKSAAAVGGGSSDKEGNGTIASLRLEKPQQHGGGVLSPREGEPNKPPSTPIKKNTNPLCNEERE